MTVLNRKRENLREEIAAAAKSCSYLCLSPWGQTRTAVWTPEMQRVWSCMCTGLTIAHMRLCVSMYCAGTNVTRTFGMLTFIAAYYSWIYWIFIGDKGDDKDTWNAWLHRFEKKEVDKTDAWCMMSDHDDNAAAHNDDNDDDGRWRWWWWWWKWMITMVMVMMMPTVMTEMDQNCQSMVHLKHLHEDKRICCRDVYIYIYI